MVLLSIFKKLAVIISKSLYKRLRAITIAIVFQRLQLKVIII